MLEFVVPIMIAPAEEPMEPRFRFEHAFIDLELEGRDFAHTVAADFNRDGRPKFVLRRQYGEIYWCDHEAPGKWTLLNRCERR